MNKPIYTMPQEPEEFMLIDKDGVIWERKGRWWITKGTGYSLLWNNLLATYGPLRPAEKPTVDSVRRLIDRMTNDCETVEAVADAIHALYEPWME